MRKEPARAWVAPMVRSVAILVLGAAGIVAGCLPDRAGTPTPTPAPTSTASTLASVGPALAPVGPTTEAKVVRVIDGDTIVVDFKGKQVHLRYIGMDTPESVKPNTPVELMAREATAANEALVAGRTVLLEKDVSETDRFGRLLRDVWVERDGRLVLVGLELVRTGYANVSTFPPDVRYVDELLAALDQAREAGVGLWAPTPIP